MYWAARNRLPDDLMAGGDTCGGLSASAITGADTRLTEAFCGRLLNVLREKCGTNRSEDFVPDALKQAALGS